MVNVKIYTDGSCLKPNGPSGWAFLAIESKRIWQFSDGIGASTNNRMELLAVIVGLEKLKNPQMTVLVISDSKYVVDSVEKKWVIGWEKKGFANRKNSDLWKRFLKVYRQHKVDFKWIKGHNNHPQNERCDELAVYASGLINLSVDFFYEKEEEKLL